jgi:hypothetical protein
MNLDDFLTHGEIEQLRSELDPPVRYPRGSLITAVAASVVGVGAVSGFLLLVL